MSRYGNPITAFRNYIKADPDAKGNRMQPAAKVDEDALNYVRKYWQLPEIQVGEYLLMHPAGKGEAMSAEEFEQTYVIAQTTAQCNHMENHREEAKTR